MPPLFEDFKLLIQWELISPAGLYQAGDGHYKCHQDKTF